MKKSKKKLLKLALNYLKKNVNDGGSVGNGFTKKGTGREMPHGFSGGGGASVRGLLFTGGSGSSVRGFKKGPKLLFLILD